MVWEVALVADKTNRAFPSQTAQTCSDLGSAMAGPNNYATFECRITHATYSTVTDFARLRG